jgi:hypothetical protein
LWVRRPAPHEHAGRPLVSRKEVRRWEPGS